MAATAVDKYHEEGRKRTYADAFESVVWDWCDISSRYCSQKSYQHVHCVCKRCDGKATSRKVEFEHWKCSQLLGSNLCWKNVHQSNMQTNSISATDQSSKITDYSDEDQRGENPKG